MYQVTETFNTTHDKDEALATALSTILAKEPAEKCEIIDNETGEVLFVYEHGNVDYMAGDFAKALINAVVDSLRENE